MEHSLVAQLEDVLASKDISRRADILRKVTDLFVLGSGSFSDDQVELFDDVMGKLMENVERSACAQFGSRLAAVVDAPPGVIRALAFHDAIEVAGPVLQHSERLDETTLIETARTKGQDHLLAISGRKVLAEAVTDILVDRGNEAVVSNTARNAGARFSDLGISKLVEKARDDSSLAMCVWSRPDIPRQNLVKLFVDVSEAVRKQLTEVDPRRADLIRAAVGVASEQIQATARAGSGDFAQAHAQMSELHAAGKLDEAQLAKFAEQADFDRVTASLSLLCDLPIGSVERAFVQQQPEQIILMAKALGLSWVTTVALLLLHTGANSGSRQQLDLCFANFSRLQQKTAVTALQFYRMREKAMRSTRSSTE